MRDKARTAVDVHVDRRDDAARIYEALHKQAPDDLDIQVYLARLYFDLGNKDKAKPLIDDAVAKVPNRADWKLYQTRIAGGDVQASAKR